MSSNRIRYRYPDDHSADTVGFAPPATVWIVPDRMETYCARREGDETGRTQ